MIKKTQLAIFAAIIMTCGITTCGTSYGQNFTQLTPSSLGLGQNESAINQVFDIGDQFGHDASDIRLQVTNGHTANGSDFWTVSETQSATFSILSSIPIEAYVQHGENLGSSDFQNGSASVDGLIANLGEDFTLISALDSDYQQTVNGNDYSVSYIGPDTGVLERNAAPFRWVSDQPVTGFDVYTNNSLDLNNNYAIGFRTAASSVPEPSATAILALASSLILLRRRRS